jgi:hypothetical protein
MYTNLAVSKLCCPACWHLLGLLQDTRFGVRGHHHKMFPMELPPWLPKDYAQLMVDELRRMLCSEISAMMDGQCPGCSSISSLQSVGSLTASSVVSNSTLTSGEHTNGLDRIGHTLRPKRFLNLSSFKLKLWYGP